MCSCRLVACPGGPRRRRGVSVTGRQAAEPHRVGRLPKQPDQGQRLLGLRERVRARVRVHGSQACPGRDRHHEPHAAGDHRGDRPRSQQLVRRQGVRSPRVPDQRGGWRRRHHRPVGHRQRQRPDRGDPDRPGAGQGPQRRDRRRQRVPVPLRIEPEQRSVGRLRHCRPDRSRVRRVRDRDRGRVLPRRRGRHVHLGAERRQADLLRVRRFLRPGHLRRDGQGQHVPGIPDAVPESLVRPPGVAEHGPAVPVPE